MAHDFQHKNTIIVAAYIGLAIIVVGTVGIIYNI